jgi:hypothetical protein
LILLVDPDKEGLIVIVVDSSCIRPISIKASSFKESVSFLEEEVVFDKLLSLLLSQRGESIVFSVELTLESG